MTKKSGSIDAFDHFVKIRDIVLRGRAKEKPLR